MRRIIRYGGLTLGLSALVLFLFMVMSLCRLDDAYAQWGAADMVIDFMEDHDGTWPKDWSDLQPYFEASGGRVSGWSYDRFQQHVWIDFSADPNELRKRSQFAKTPPFNVIDSTSFFGPQFDDGPNGMLMRYFNPEAPYPYSATTATVEPLQ